MKTFPVFLACALAVWLPLEARAQNTTPPLQERLYADAMAKETAVRKALADPQVSDTVLKAVRTVVADYEALVRRFPRSGYCDDALWRGGLLSLDAFKQFGESQDRNAGVRLLRALASEYPASRLAKQAPGIVAKVPDAVAAAERSTPEPSRQAAAVQAPPVEALPSRASAAPSVPKAPARVATITAIRRTVLPDAVRITIELDSEVSFHDERLENPLRVFVDLPQTRPAPELMDRTIRFESDADVVRQVRIGRHPNSMTRVVIDAADISAYSVYPLYNPDRLVIDCIRPKVPGTIVAPPIDDEVASATVLDNAPKPLMAASPVPETLPGPPLDPAVMPGRVPVETATIAPSGPIVPPSPPARNLQGGFSMARQLGLGVSRIVIDPGHGGQDPGAVGQGINEAELVLDVSLRLERLLARVPGVEVILTRRTDAYLPLQERTAIANREGADLFLSIHANSSANKKATGVETYILNFASSASAAAIAARENAASGQSMAALPDFVKNIALNNKVQESRDFATLVQRAMIARLRPANKAVLDLGVKQAPFIVLIGAAMPSVLAEISFLSNAQDVRLLKTSAYRQRIAEALFDATINYQRSLKTGGTVAQQQ